MPVSEGFVVILAWWEALLSGVTLDQIMIGVLGVTAIWLSQHEKEDLRKYACLLGLGAQPFWFYSAWTAGQWGIFILCFFYAYAWFKGFRVHWLPLLKRAMVK